ncbi:hypothetical protein JY97_02720 [Alkalispirochaeta odontotermitis]|nr:hypothetical protein JY97_02720 [Alkalispirochaeta odontotermitis]CAB1077312.1 hypothetical protein D1AOALGA4SA_5102 [Olavius algarvensis Delta 1 endosymbiont]
MKLSNYINYFLAAILLVAAFNPSVLAADKPIGLVVALRGKVIALNPSGAQRRLAVQSKIFAADTIKTGPRGRVQLMFDDNTLVSLARNTDMQIAEYQWNPAQKTGAMKTRVNEGVFRIMGGAITQAAPRNFETETPAGTIGIRGSMYAGKVAGSSLELLFQGGKGIYFSNDVGTVNIDRPGFGTFVAGPTSRPTEPTRFSREDIDRLEDVAVDPPAGGGEDEPGDPQPDSNSQAPSDTNEAEPTDPAPESQTPDDSASEPDTADDSQPVQGLEPLSAFDEPDTADDSTLPGQSTIAGNQTSSAFSSPVDTVKNTVNEAVIDSIESVRQERVLEIEQSILDLLQEMGFVGERSLSTPNNGIEQFDGVIRHKIVESQEHSQDSVKMAVNWHNHKFFAVLEGDDPLNKHFPVFIFGDIQGTALADMTVVGGGLDPEGNQVSTISGSGVFGQFYGTQTDAVGFAMRGVDVDVHFQSNQQSWTAYSAALSKGEPLPTDTAPGGTHILRGFVMGIAEDMAAPHLNRRIFMNDMATDFRLTVDKDAGTVSGQLSAADFNLSGSTIAGLQIGDPLDSAYVLDDAIIALLGGTDTITNGASVGDLKEYGNYLVTEKQADSLSPYTTWGYWEIAYQDPASGTDYHVHHPIAYWIAGPQTPATEVNSLIAANFSGIYAGGAEGIQIDPGGMISELTGGASNFTIDFTPSATTPLTGNITFDQVGLNVISNPGDVNANGFSGFVNGAVSSKVKGTYFGPNAAAIGGNFGARMSTGDEYYGIFGGSR